MFKNFASQKIAVFAFTTTDGSPKTGDSANITVYLSKDYGTLTQLTDTSATELDATNAKGWYVFDVSQTECNADVLLFSGKSGTANVSVVGQLIHTLPVSMAAVGRGTVGSASTTTSIVTSAMSPAGAATDQFKGRIITFDSSTTTTALRGQATDITGSTSSATPTFTVTALTTAPASGDTFSIT